MRKGYILTVLVPFMLLALFFVNSPAKATTWDTLSYCPSSLDDNWRESGVPIADPINSWAARELSFGFFVDLTSTDYKFLELSVSNWTWERWNGFDDPTLVDHHPPGTWGGITNNNVSPGGNISMTLGIPWPTIYSQSLPNFVSTGDVIVSVQAVLYFASFHSPSFYFGISTNDGTTYPIQSSTYPAYYDGNPKMFAWNVTGLRSWVPADFSDPDVRLMANMEIMPSIFYGLDYLGFVIEYQAGPNITSPYTIGNVWLDISGSFGVIGFIGMTICPAYAIMQWRQGGDGRVVRFIMSIAAMLVFFTLFLASLGA